MIFKIKLSGSQMLSWEQKKRKRYSNSTLSSVLILLNIAFAVLCVTKRNTAV